MGPLSLFVLSGGGGKGDRKNWEEGIKGAHKVWTR